MKKYTLLVAFSLFIGLNAKAITADSDTLGLPGDNLDLAGVLDLFKTSTSLEDFEKKLNDPLNEVNNLDLNQDQNVDYLSVIDQVSGEAHAIVIQVAVSADEVQDVAVIELEKNGTESADLQISGDEELYGENYFVEPSEDGEGIDNGEGKWQGFRPVVVFVNVWGWPCVRYVYAPTYVIWVSPYRWNYYPNYWKPWHPVAWQIHHNRVVRYHHHCAYVHECRMRNAHAYHASHRMGSPAVHRHYAAHHERHNARMNGGQKTNNQNGNKNAGAKGGQKAGPKSGGGKKAGGGGNKGGGGGHKGGGGKKR